MTSSNFRAAVYAQFSDDAIFPLVTISGTGVDTLYLVPNTEDVVSNGTTFQPFPLSITMPEQDPSTIPVMKFQVTGIAKDVIEALRLVTTPLTVAVQFVLKSDPDTVELSWPAMKLRNAQFDAQNVTGDLRLGDLMTERFPLHSFTPGNSPGVFKAQNA